MQHRVSELHALTVVLMELQQVLNVKSQASWECPKDRVIQGKRPRAAEYPRKQKTKQQQQKTTSGSEAAVSRKQYGEKGKEKRWESKDLKQGKRGETYNFN